ncbi:MAG: DNA polymerase III subunit delta [Methylococcaceae bacterium]|jgi:DNA polymerase-3 subunit delta
MRLKPEQLNNALKKNLQTIYLLSGDDPQQMGELADAVRQAGGLSGFARREILSVEANFDWQELVLALNTYTLFSDKKIVDLRLSKVAIGVEAAKILQDYCLSPSEDILLLISAPKLTTAALKAKWLQAIEAIGVIVQVWPLNQVELIVWLQKRLQQRGMTVNEDTVKLLALRVEGNLLAAAQEVDKLYMLYGSGRISEQQLLDAVTDSSRYAVFDLVDSLLRQEIDRTLKILTGLRKEGVAAPVVLWAIAREVRVLMALKKASISGQSSEAVFKSHQIWDKRKALLSTSVKRLSVNALNKALKASAKIDRQIKGRQAGDAWESLQLLCLQLAGLELMAGLP